MIGWPPQAGFLTQREWLVSYLAALAALAALLAGHPVFAAAAGLPPLPLLAYRSQRRVRAARRAGLLGFVQQMAAVPDAERERKVAAIARELGDWPPGGRWLREVDRRLARDPSRSARRRRG